MPGIRDALGQKQIHWEKRRLRSIPTSSGSGGVAEHPFLGAAHRKTVTGDPIQGAMVLGNSTPEWDLLAHPAAAGYALVTDATDVAWDQTPTWTGDHTWDDGDGDSPALHFITQIDDQFSLWAENAIAGNSDFVVKFPAADTDSQFIWRDSGDNDVAYVDADGNTTWDGTAHRFGVADLGPTTLAISGAATGSAAGGQINIELAADYDGVFNSWGIDSNQDDLRFFRSDAVVANAMTAEGGLLLPTTGSGAGVWIGGDAQWYRSAANQMATPDDLYLAGAGLGIIHVDGVVAGNYLRADGTRYVPNTIQAADLPGSFSGFANPTASVGLVAVNGAATTAMRSDAAPPIDVGIIPTWTGAHTHAANVIMDDGVGNSPMTVYTGGTNDDTAEIYLLDDGTPGDSHLIVQLCDDADSRLILRNSSAANVINFYATGAATFTSTVEIDVVGGVDPIIIFDTSAADRFAIGVDDSDSDKFKINSGATLANPSDFELDSSGNVEIAGDFNLLTGKGVVHADGVVAGNYLRADGTRYVPNTIQAGDLPGSFSGFANPTASVGLVAVNGAATTAMRSDAAPPIDVGIAPTWTSIHTHAANVVLDDGSGNSPQVQFVGGTNDDTAVLYLLNSATPGDSHLIAQLCDDADSRLILRNNSGTNMIMFYASGYAWFDGNVDINAHRLILDADSDAYLHSPSDDVAEFVLPGAGGQLQININGADDFTFTANSLNVPVGSTVSFATGTGITHADSGAGDFLKLAGGLYAPGAIVAADLPGSFSGFANPTASVGTAAVNGAATTAMRSDAAPAIDQGMTPTWTALHTFTNALGIEIDTTGADPKIVLDADAADRFAIGVDISDSYKFKINSGSAVANPSDFELDSSGNVEIAGDFNLLTGKGIIHADGVTAGWLLVGDGTRYVPSNPAASLPVAPGARGHILRAEAGPVWASYNAATNGAALVGDGTDIISDTTPSWAGLHTFTADLEVAEYLRHIGDADTYIRFQPDNITFVAGGAAGMLDLVEAGTDYASFGVQVRLGGNLLYLDADVDSYLYSSGDDVVDFVLAGALGELGININAAEDFTFTANSLNVLSGSFVMMADDTGIGIGAAAGRITFDDQATDQIEVQDAVLIVNGTTTDTEFTASIYAMDSNIGISRDGDPAALHLFGYGTIDVDYGVVRHRYAAGSRGTPTAAQSGAILGRWGAGGYGATGFTATSTAFLQAEAAENFTDAAMGTHLDFYTAPRSSLVAAARMRITASGRVKVGGTAGATGQLDVDQPSASGGIANVRMLQNHVTQPFLRMEGTAAVGDINRSIVDEGDQSTTTLAGWVLVNVQDAGSQISNGKYWMPLYTLT